MSKASRLAAADAQIVPSEQARRTPSDAAFGQLGRNSAAIPGGIGRVEMPGEVEVCGIRWTPKDGECWSATIGAALAVEMTGKA